MRPFFEPSRASNAWTAALQERLRITRRIGFSRRERKMSDVITFHTNPMSRGRVIRWPPAFAPAARRAAEIDNAAMPKREE